MVTNKEIAELIFPEVKETIEDLEKRYPKRKLPNGAEVTRFAPSLPLLQQDFYTPDLYLLL